MMKAINTADAKRALDRLIADVNKESVPVTITGNNGNNAVLLSETDWNALMETVYLNSVPGLAESIIEARNEPIGDSTVYDEDEEW